MPPSLSPPIPITPRPPHERPHVHDRPTGHLGAAPSPPPLPGHDPRARTGLEALHHPDRHLRRLLPGPAALRDHAAGADPRLHRRLPVGPGGDPVADRGAAAGQVFGSADAGPAGTGLRLSFQRPHGQRPCPDLSRPVQAHRAAGGHAPDHGLALHVLARGFPAAGDDLRPHQAPDRERGGRGRLRGAAHRAGRPRGGGRRGQPGRAGQRGCRPAARHHGRQQAVLPGDEAGGGHGLPAQWRGCLHAVAKPPAQRAGCLADGGMRQLDVRCRAVRRLQRRPLRPGLLLRPLLRPARGPVHHRRAVVREHAVLRAAGGRPPARHRAKQRTAAALCQGPGTGPVEDQFLRQHEPRDTHAHERDHRRDVPAQTQQPDPGAGRTPGQDRPGQQAPAVHHQRHPGLLENRERRHVPGTGGFSAQRRPGPHPLPDRGTGSRQEPGDQRRLRRLPTLAGG